MCRIRTWTDYYIPGTFVLRNKFVTAAQPFGETDPITLRAKEESRVAIRLIELAMNPVHGDFDYEHFKAIHRHLFQDVYEWAGEERVGPDTFMTKDGHAYYPGGPALTEAANTEFGRLAANDFLHGLDHTTFVRELAEAWGELNVIHSFREGNTRTQIVFFAQLCEQAGYELDVGQFKIGSQVRDDFVAARFHSQDTGSNARLAATLAHVVHRVR